MVGIYSIQSPSGKVYIGQSWDIKRRHIFYKSTLAKAQPYLNNSFKKYGFDSHKIKVVHELPNDVEQAVLNSYEQLYMDAYRDCNILLLNCKEAGSNGKCHPESIEKTRQKNIGKKRTEDFKKRQSEKAKNYVRTEEWCRKLSESKKGCKSSMKGKAFSDEFRKNVSRGRSEWCKSNMDAVGKRIDYLASLNCRAVIQYTKSGEFIKEWKSGREAEKELGIFSTSISAAIRGVRCKHAGGFKWAYKK